MQNKAFKFWERVPSYLHLEMCPEKLKARLCKREKSGFPACKDVPLGSPGFLEVHLCK